MSLSTIAVIPVYNHPEAIGWMVQGVRAQGLPVLLVDDGSDARCAAVLDQLHAAEPDQVGLLRLAQNQGKGGAVLAGFRQALQQGYSHGLQIDADGQHDPEQIPQFLIASAAAPDAVICGVPRYDDSVPKSRLYGRYLTHVWVWINTLSLQIKDSMCGFRIYPLQQVQQVADTETVGRRMDFDPEILVRLHWRGCQVFNIETPVTYPRDGISHFDVWRDNVFISRMHTRLFFGMLWRLPKLLWRRLRR